MYLFPSSPDKQNQCPVCNQSTDVEMISAGFFRHFGIGGKFLTDDEINKLRKRYPFLEKINFFIDPTTIALVGEHKKSSSLLVAYYTSMRAAFHYVMIIEQGTNRYNIWHLDCLHDLQIKNSLPETKSRTDILFLLFDVRKPGVERCPPRKPPPKPLSDEELEKLFQDNPIPAKKKNKPKKVGAVSSPSASATLATAPDVQPVPLQEQIAQVSQHLASLQAGIHTSQTPPSSPNLSHRSPSPRVILPFDTFIDRLRKIKAGYEALQLTSPFLQRYKQLQLANIDTCTLALQLCKAGKDIAALHQQREEMYTAQFSGLSPIIASGYISELQLSMLIANQIEHNRVISEIVQSFQDQLVRDFFAGFFAVHLPSSDNPQIQQNLMEKFCRTQTFLHNLGIAFKKINPQLKMYGVGTQIFMLDRADDLDIMVMPALRFDKQSQQRESVDGIFHHLNTQLGGLNYLLEGRPKSSHYTPAALMWLNATWQSSMAMYPALDVSIYDQNNFSENMIGRRINFASICYDVVTGAMFIRPAEIATIFNNQIEFLEIESVVGPDYRNLSIAFKCFIKANVEPIYQVGEQLRSYVDRYILSEPYVCCALGIDLLNHTKSYAQLKSRYEFGIQQPLQKLGITPIQINFDYLTPASYIGEVLFILTGPRVLDVLPNLSLLDESRKEAISQAIKILLENRDGNLSEFASPFAIQLINTCRPYLDRMNTMHQALVIPKF